MNQLLSWTKNTNFQVRSANARFFLGYALFIGLTNLVWESLHLPLYTLWVEGEFGELVFAVVHCTGGDVMIALTALGVSLLLVGNIRLPHVRFNRVMGLTIGIGILYTLYSEWLNVTIRESWAYSDLMPIIPIIDTGLSPIAQWIFIPLLGLLWARKKFLPEEISND